MPRRPDVCEDRRKVRRKGRCIRRHRRSQGSAALPSPSQTRRPIRVPQLHPARLSDGTEPFTLRRRGIETKIIAGETVPAPDPVLQRSLAEAHLWAKALRAGNSLIEIARRTGRSEPYVRNRIPLAFLAPHLQAAILDGRQPADFSVAKLVRDGIAMDWKEQARMLGVG